MGTIWKNVASLLMSLTNILVKDKKAKKEEKEDNKLKKLQLAYNLVLVVIVHKCLCFLWQDNNTVCVITIAYSLHQQAD